MTKTLLALFAALSANYAIPVLLDQEATQGRVVIGEHDTVEEIPPIPKISPWRSRKLQGEHKTHALRACKTGGLLWVPAGGRLTDGKVLQSSIDSILDEAIEALVIPPYEGLALLSMYIDPHQECFKAFSDELQWVAFQILLAAERAFAATDLRDALRQKAEYKAITLERAKGALTKLYNSRLLYLPSGSLTSYSIDREAVTEFVTFLNRLRNHLCNRDHCPKKEA